MREKVIKRLSGYWKMEAANAVLVPGMALLAVLRFGDRLSWPLLLAMLACSFLLVIGAIAWRMELRSLQGDAGFATLMMPWLAMAKLPSLVLALASLAGAAFEYVTDAGWSPSAIATAVLAVLAALEYVNYYVVQLQHFDHAADFKRLLTGRGFREAHLARALRLWHKR
jgi:hypothetical protein